MLDRLEEKHNTGELDHELAVKVFTKLKEEFSSEFQEFELSYCAKSLPSPVQAGWLNSTPNYEEVVGW